jgi:hypothetical protein
VAQLWKVPRWAWAAVLGTAAVALAVLDPAKAGRSLDCPFHWATGLYCPGCGTLRAVHQALHGHLRAALGLNALAVAALPLLLGLALPSGGARPGALRRLAYSPAFSRACLAAILVFWAARNIPVWPLTLLAP